MCLILYPCYKLLKKSCLGIYSGIFVIYIQCPSNNSESRTRSANIIFYILCLLYILCAATVVCDLLEGVFAVSNKFNCHGKNIIFIISCAVPFFLCTCFEGHRRAWHVRVLLFVGPRFLSEACVRAKRRLLLTMIVMLFFMFPAMHIPLRETSMSKNTHPIPGRAASKTPS